MVDKARKDEVVKCFSSLLQVHNGYDDEAVPNAGKTSIAAAEAFLQFTRGHHQSLDGIFFY